MMMETMYDPYDILFGDDQKSLPSDGLMFNDEIMLSDFNTDSSSISPIANTIDYSENNFDAGIFEDLVNQLISSDPSLIKEHSYELPFESEPPTREMGTDPMEPVPSTLPIIIKTTGTNQYINKPIFLIRSTATTDPTMPFEYSSVTTDDYQIEDNLPLTPSSSSESHDDGNSNSPDSLQNTNYPSMLTDLDNLPTSGSLILTNEEIKIIKQEGYQVPTKLPLNKTEEKMLKKIRRKIKNKISAQESRRKKKEYVDALEKQIAQYIDENKTLKDRMNKIEKNQKVLAQERDLLRSMIGKGTTPAPSTALMVFAVFFAALFGVWAPTPNKTSHGDKSLAFMPSHNHQSIIPNHQSLFEQQDTANSNNYKSRVLLSIDEYDNHHQHHGPYLPSNNKYQSTFQPQTAAPGYTYSNNVEKYMNKKLSNEQSNTNFKRSMTFTEEPAYKKLRSNYHINENIVVIEETTNEFDIELNESKPVKIIRVERTLPMIGNDTLKLAHRTINE